MTATVVLRTASRRRWLNARRRGLGATDAAAILGHNPWRTELDVWLAKREPADPNDKISFAAARGLHLERFLLAEYGRRHPGSIVDKAPALLAHPDYPHVLASLDGLAHHPDEPTVVLEVKTTGYRGAKDWWDGGIPDGYACQVLIQLAVTGLDEAHVIADIAGEYQELSIARDESWEARALPLLEEWWQRHIVDDIPPPLDASRDYPQLNRVWTPVPGVSTEADEQLMAKVRAWAELADVAKTRATEVTRLKTEIRAAMRTATALTYGDQVVVGISATGAMTCKYTEENR